MDSFKSKYSCRRVKFSTKRLKKRKCTFYGLTKQEKCVNIDLNNVNSNGVNMTDSVDNVDSESVFASVSKRKVKPIIVQSKHSKCVSGYRFVDMEILASVFDKLGCPECVQPMLSLIENKKSCKGFASKLSICCICGFKLDFYTSKNVEGYDVNKRVVYAMRTLGQGQTGLHRFATLMNMPRGICNKSYNVIVHKLVTAAQTVSNETIHEAVQELREGKSPDEIVDIGVSVDGTWQKRGYSSHNGVTAALSIKNGKVLDVKALSRKCKICDENQNILNSKQQNQAEFKTHVCNKNYDGSASGMETVGAVNIFNRSLEKFKLRYTEYLGDGDSKSYTTVKSTYKDVEVIKLDCVGHFQKRIGSRCRQLKKQVKGLNGKGRLTNAIIDRLQNHSGISIRQNCGNFKGMRSSGLASLFHVASSSKNNYHYPHCPVGKDSWCKYNRDKANGTNEYKPGIGLPIDIILKLKPIYVELTSDSYLSRLLHGKTQNQNESFNAMIWSRIPKSKYVSLTQLKFGLYDAIGAFNIGIKSSILIFEKLLMIPGQHTISSCNYLNRRRIRMSEYKNKDTIKKRRKILRGRKHKKSDKFDQKEGNMYKAGFHD